MIESTYLSQENSLLRSFLEGSKNEYKQKSCVPLYIKGDYSFIKSPHWLAKLIKDKISEVHPTSLDNIIIEADNKKLQMEIYFGEGCENKHKLSYLSLLSVFLYKKYTESGRFE